MAASANLPRETPAQYFSVTIGSANFKENVGLALSVSCQSYKCDSVTLSFYCSTLTISILALGKNTHTTNTVTLKCQLDLT